MRARRDFLVEQPFTIVEWPFRNVKRHSTELKGRFRTVE